MTSSPSTKKTTSLLIVDDEESIVKVFQRVAKNEKLSCAACKNGIEAMDYLSKHEVECVLLDINLPKYSGFEILEYIKSMQRNTEVILITGSGSVENAVKALKAGAYDYLTKPFDSLDKVTLTIRNAITKCRLVMKVKSLEESTEEMDSFEGIIGRSKPMQEIYRVIKNISIANSSVLIQGESGTGKELVAKAIHQTSKRKNHPFVVINCAAIPEGLLESELFGHAKGSFTGAYYDKKGLFEEGNHGTVFLDEIGEVPQSIQVKLLRVLQNGEIKPVGGNENKHVDVRIIAATNKELLEMTKVGTFREDLYYRLNVIGINMPSLKERAEDIPLLCQHFLKKYNEKTSKNITGFSIDSMQALQSYHWVGNVRELENTVERSVVLAAEDQIKAKDLPVKILSSTFYMLDDKEEDLTKFSYQDAKTRALHIFNKTYIKNILHQARGNISVASDRAGMDRSNFKKIVKKYDIDVNEFRKSS